MQKLNKFPWGAFLVVILTVGFFVGLYGGIAYVVFHFISKFW